MHQSAPEFLFSDSDFPLLNWLAFYESASGSRLSVMLLLREGMTHSENSRICEAVKVRLKAMVTFGTL